MKKILTAIVSVSIFIVGILLILCADTNFLWYAFNQKCSPYSSCRDSHCTCWWRWCDNESLVYSKRIVQ